VAEMSDEIRDAVVVVAQAVDRLDNLKQHAAEVETLVDNCQLDATNALNELGADHQQLMGSLEQYRQSADSNMAQIADRLAALSITLQDWSQTGQQDGSQFQAELANLEKEYQQFESRCQTINSTVDKAAAASTKAFENLVSQVNENLNQVQTASQSLSSEIASLASTITQSVESASSTGETVAEKIKQSLETADNRIRELIQEVQETGETYENTIVELCDDVTIPKLEELTEELQEFLREKIKECIDEVFQELVDQCKNSVGDIFGFESENSISREAIEPVVKQLDDLLKPLAEAACHVKSVADKIKRMGF
jgi:predicted  nucleic acid-binding Zn-ribbon protein